MSLGVYIHIPFCGYKCHYCDFVTSLRTKDLQAQYCQIVAAEISGRLQDCAPLAVSSISYGGGTPSILESNYLVQVHQTLLANINLLPNSEISLEATPETVTKEKAKIWRELGFNRLSIGVQSFNDQELISLNRGHTVVEAIAAINTAAQAGFDNINCDLMYGLPGQTLNSWQSSISQFIKLAKQFPQLKHLSAYGLELSPNAPLVKIFPANSEVYPNEEWNEEQFLYLLDSLSQAGFAQYEISNFAKDEYRSKHNLNYWQQGEYQAFGVSAHRYIKPYRSANWRSLKQYLSDYLNNEIVELIDENTAIKEAIMLGLRLTDGIHIKQFEQSFNFNLIERHAKLIDNLISQDMVIYSNDNLKLTRFGQRMANTVISEFF